MSATVVQFNPPVAPPTMALFYSMDHGLKFGCQVCNETTLLETVHGVMFVLAAGETMSIEQEAECKRYVQGLRESGSISFEDGWLELRVGLLDALAFVIERADEQRKEAEWSDQQRAEEYRRANEIAAKYAGLCTALRNALGEHTRGIIDLASLGKPT